MSSHALRVIHAGSLGVGGICSSPDGCGWETTKWRANVQWVERDHRKHIREQEAAYWMDGWTDMLLDTVLMDDKQEEQADV